MAIVTMPKAGQSMEEGTILRWYKQEGESVEKGEILFEIDTDKASVEVEAPQSGILRKVLCPEGETLPVLAPVAIIAGASDDISGELAEAGAQPGAEPSPAPHQAAAEPPAPSPGAQASGGAATDTRLKASPAARRVAGELEVDLGAAAPGSGPGGRILSTDVAAAASARAVQAPASAPAAQPAPAVRPVEKQPVAQPAPAARPAPAATPAVDARGATIRPLAGMRRAIARAMLNSKQAVPHFYMKLTIDAGPLHAFYRRAKAQHPCTINDIVTLACARVIRDFPAFRSRLEDDQIVEYPAASIGVAVGVEEGLVVPVVIGADSMSLPEIARETQRVIEAARNGKVVAMGQGVFTVSNLGGFGIEEFTAIINPPEAAILAVGALRESVIVRDEGMRPGKIMTMTLSADHRLIDGLMAARFMLRLKELLEKPESLNETV